MNPTSPVTDARAHGTVRAALYARVSTLNGQDPELQLRELREYASRRGWQIVGEFVDSGVSGAKDSRPELNRLMADAHKRRFDVVCVWKFDRFAQKRQSPLTGVRDIQGTGYRVLLVFRANGHVDPDRPNDLHCAGRRRRIGTQLDRRTRPSGSP